MLDVSHAQVPINYCGAKIRFVLDNAGHITNVLGSDFFHEASNFENIHPLCFVASLCFALLLI